MTHPDDKNLAEEAAEQAFEEWWAGQMKGYDIQPSLGTKAAAKAAYLAATERTARRCREICGRVPCSVPESAGADKCAIAIAKEFGLE
jgi:hypothetical protein